MSYNVIYTVLHRLKQLFIGHGLKFVKSNIIVARYDNFDFLRMKDHNSTSTKDTFMLTKHNEKQLVMRTHSTAFQRHVFEQHGDRIKHAVGVRRNIGFFTYGKVFRKDDSSMHSYCFHQCDILMYNCEYKSIYEYIEYTMSIISHLCNTTLQYRIRESYFPFTLPSYEIDIMYNNKYIEILGCGFEHKAILQHFSIVDTNIFALGVGIERLASLIFNVHNIKTLRLQSCYGK